MCKPKLDTISKGTNDKQSTSNTKAIGKQTPFERYTYITSGDENNNLKLSAFAQALKLVPASSRTSLKRN